MEIELSQKEYKVSGQKKHSAVKKILDQINHFSKAYGGLFCIIGLCVFVYLTLGLILNSDSPGDLIQWGGNIIPLSPIEFFRFVTAIFLHATFFHLLLNMISAYYLAIILDKIWDGSKTFIVFFVTGIIANILAFYIRSFFHTDVVLSIGASGGIFGLMGALLGFYYFNKSLSVTLKKYYSQRILSLFIFNILLGLLITNIDLLVHCCGFLAGILTGFFIEKMPYRFYKSNQTFWSVLWLCSMACIVYCFIVATTHYWQAILQKSS